MDRNDRHHNHNHDDDDDALDMDMEMHLAVAMLDDSDNDSDNEDPLFDLDDRPRHRGNAFLRRPFRARNLPVAVPVRPPPPVPNAPVPNAAVVAVRPAANMRDRHWERRRRRIRFRMRADLFRGNNNNNDAAQEQRILDQLEQNHLAHHAFPWEQPRQPRQPQRAPPDVSRFLMDLVREDLPCSSVLSGSNVRGCATIVKRCQEHPDEVHFQCPRTGRTPLHEAALRCSCRHVIQAILQVDNVRALHLDTRQNTPLHLLFLGIANRRMDPDDMQIIVDLLLQPLPNMVGTIRNRDGCLPLHCACAAPETMVPPGTIQRLITATPSAASRTNNREQTPLHLHCQRRNASPQVAQLLLEACPSAIRTRDRTPAAGYTPLHYAAAHSNRALLQLLVQQDADAAKTRTLETEKTPLHILCEKNPNGPDDVACIQLLLSAAAETALWPEQTTLYTPLHMVCRGTRGVSLEVVQALVQAAPEALVRVDHNQYLPLHYAAEHGTSPAVIATLLQAYPAAASSRTRKKDTALSLACAANHSVETVQLLLQANPDAALQPNVYGFLPLHCICRAYQAQTAICQAVVTACPQAVWKTTNAGESAWHLAGSNISQVGIWSVLQRTLQSLQQQQQQEGANPNVLLAAALREEKSLTSSTVGNTPLHLVCFSEFSRPHIESMAESNPEWITVRNNAGYSPLQLLCKNGRIDNRIVTLFSRLCGPEIFSSVDLMGNTPLHSAMREETDLEALRAIIRAYPDALHMKTTYEDTPLHLACLRKVRPEIVHELALASSIGLEKALANCNGRISPLLIQNTAGQTPFGIAMEEYQKNCHGVSCCTQADLSVEQARCFETVAALAKMLHYGPTEDNNRGQSLVGACVALHRKGARIDPAFIHRALIIYPEEARLTDENGNTPLHIEASIPVEKMSLLDAATPGGGGCTGAFHKRMTVLRRLVEIYPEATRQRNASGDFPLQLMVQNGRPWDSSFALVIRTYPEAFHWVRNIDSKLNPRILALFAAECGSETLYALIRARPEFLG